MDIVSNYTPSVYHQVLRRFCRDNMSIKRLTAIIAIVIFVSSVAALCVFNDEAQAEDGKNITFNVDDAVAITIDEGETPEYITESGQHILAPGDHKISVYEEVAGDPASYSLLRTKTISVDNDTTFTISTVNITLGNEGFVLDADYKLTAKIIDYYGSLIAGIDDKNKTVGVNNAYLDGQKATYALFNDETLSVLIDPKDTSAYKPAEVLTMGGTEAKNFTVTLDNTATTRFTVPDDVNVSLSIEKDRQGGDFTIVYVEANNELSSSTVRAYDMEKAGNHYLRISGDNYLTTYVWSTKADPTSTCSISPRSPSWTA